MARNTLVINCDLRETRVALIEDGVIAELHIERAASRSTVGNIVLGRVSRVLPGMQAAFIDVGMDRAAFLHVEDLIKPADFETYLAGSPRGDDDEPSGRGEGGRRQRLPRPDLIDDDDDDDDDDVNGDADDRDLDDGDADDDDDDGDDAANGSGADEELNGDAAAAGGSEDDDDEDDEDIVINGADSEDLDDDEDLSGADAEDLDEDEDEDEEDEDADGGEDDDEEDPEDESEAVAASAAEEDAEDDEPSGELLSTTDTADSGWEPAPAVSDAASQDVAVAAADAPPVDAWEDESSTAEGNGAATGDDGAAAADDGAGASRVSEDNRGRRRRRRRRRTNRKDGEGAVAAAPAPAPVAERPGRSRRAGRSGGERRERGGDRRDRGGDRRERRGSNGKNGKNGKKSTSRVSRSVPITEVVKEGDQVVVQITKEPIGTKGARVSSHVSLPGRYAVYLPTVEHVGISKRIGGGRERSRLREVIDSLKPAMGGLIVRTVAEGLTKKQLKADVGYLMKLWADIATKKKEARAPAILYSELDIVLKTARDLFTDEIETIVIDDKDQYVRLVRFVEMFLPGRVKDIHLYQGQEPIFDAYGIEDEIGRALSRKVPLPSGGYLVIDQAEALAAIDVNTGRFIGKGSKDLEETALKTNLEAVEEIAYQLRFRNIGGLVILDLIDMEVSSNRDKVFRSLEQRLAKDKAKTTINRISELGLIEMTRKRTRESLSRTMNEPCFYCDGTGQIQSRQTIAYEILRQIRRERASLAGYSVIVNAHPAIVDLLQTEEREAVQEAERRYMRRIELVPRTEYHIEQFDLQGK
ncbi:MAG: Rne/Rng family ribonuclease [Polyangiaceae bacterium]